MSDPLILKGNKEMQGGVVFVKDGKNLWVVTGPAFNGVLLTINQGYEIIDYLVKILPPRGKQDDRP
jgi:hypothetical protein